MSWRRPVPKPDENATMNDCTEPRVRIRPKQSMGLAGQVLEGGSSPTPDAESEPRKARIRTRPQAASTEPRKARARTRPPTISAAATFGPPAERPALDERGSRGERVRSLQADFLSADRLGRFTDARCELSTGEVVEVRGRKVPFYDMARELDARGYGEWQLQIYTPTGTPSLRGTVGELAEWTVKERDRGGLRLERFQKFPGQLMERREPDLGPQVPVGP